MSSNDDPTTPHEPVQTYHVAVPDWSQRRPIRPRRAAGWWIPVALLGILLGLSAGLYLLAPIRTNTLLLGIDRRPGETNVSRTDTMILTTVVPLRPYVGMLSIPRDLWVTLPDGSQNRINTAHFYAEGASPGTGPDAAKLVVAQNFGVTVDYYVRLNFAGLQDFVDALGGVDFNFPRPMSGYTAGRHHLNGEEALALVRDRAGTDDFARMARGQLFLEAVLKQVLRPASWSHIPWAGLTLLRSIDSDVPLWLWPRLSLAVFRAGPGGVDGRVISRDMAHGFTTQAGAQVLSPDWPRINPVLKEMFDQ
jgi:LCP family protein required for cell wall assembly